MWVRKKVRIYLRSGAVVKFRVKDWKATTGEETGSLLRYNFTIAWWHTRRPVCVRLDDVSAVVTSRW